MAKNIINNLGLGIEVTDDKLEIHAPKDIRVVKWEANDGVTVIFERIVKG